MKLLHTSDWHLGASLKTEKRQAEFEKTLDWLMGEIQRRNVEALIISGDVFDCYRPSNEATKLYYGFLMKACAAGVRDIVVTAGNHDSPSYLEAPKEVLETLNVHVIGHYDRDDLDSMLIPLKEKSGEIRAVVCAVPYLREREIRQFQAGESLEEDAARHLTGIVECYERLCARCREQYPGIPMIATGHFYATGGRSSGDHVVGSLGNVALANLPQDVTYYALGHLHLPQMVGDNPLWRYSGSLLPMDFGDIRRGKSVVLLDTADLKAEPELIEIPCFQELLELSGSMEELQNALEKLKKQGKSAWVQACNTGAFEADIMKILSSVCENSEIRLLGCRNQELNPVIAERGMFKSDQLQECRPLDLFREILKNQIISDEDQAEMVKIFEEIERELDEQEKEA